MWCSYNVYQQGLTVQSPINNQTLTPRLNIVYTLQEVGRHNSKPDTAAVSNSFTCPHQNQTSPSSSSDDQTRGAGLYESYAWMYLRTCLCVCMYFFLSSSCSIMHPFSAVGNRHRFMACDCAMSGFIRTTERKLTRATKGRFCLYLISMKTHQNRADGGKAGSKGGFH